MKDQDKSQECCPPFEPAPWDGTMHNWENKPFIKSKVCTLLHMPMNFGKVIRKMNALVEKADAQIPGWLCLSEHTSPWKMNLYLAVDKDVDGIENVNVSGKFLSKVYEGPFGNTGRWLKDYNTYAKREGHTVVRTFMWYTTCPKCAKKFGKNYVVILGEII